MPDDADLAQTIEEAFLERAIDAARGVKPRTEATHCEDCGEVLIPQRRAYGRCVPCQERREHGAAWRRYLGA